MIDAEPDEAASAKKDLNDSPDRNGPYIICLTPTSMSRHPGDRPPAAITTSAMSMTWPSENG